MKTLTYRISIPATAERVWNTLLQDASYREWTKPFNPTGSSWYEGQLKAGEPIRFVGLDAEGKTGGMLSKVAVFEPMHKISFEHYGELRDGIEDTTSERVQGWVGSHETYELKEENGLTHLTVELLVPENFVEFLENSWPAALEKVKELCA